MKSLVMALALAHAIVGCGSPPQPQAARQRKYSPGNYAQLDPALQASPGSLFSEANGGYLQDTRAVKVGDFVLVRIDESADAQGGATTRLDRDSSASVGMTGMLGILPALKKAYPDWEPEKLLEFASKAGFSGAGNTSRKGQLSGSIAVRVVRQMPNGDLFLEGTKVVLINNEQYHLYVSGLARTADIAQDNSVASSRIADAQVEFTGQGDVAEQQRKGWAARFLDSINPF